MREVVILFFSVILTTMLTAQPIAFPGAEGFGKFTTGGRGGRVIVVTNLNDDGPGSLRHAVKQKGPRIIVFAVSGYIALESPLDINNGDITIAGQSAPGDGICIRNFTTNIKADNVIVRFIRFRLGDEKGYEGDAISGNQGKNNIIIDHCTMSWSTDECASFYYNTNFTMQWCLISESLNNSIHTKGEHGYGGIWGGRKASFHHNLLASHNSRLPRFSGSSTTPNNDDELVDFRNNVVFNWKSNNTYGGEKGKYNVVGNYYKPGPASGKKNQIVDPSEPYGSFYLSDNCLYNNVSLSKDNRLGLKSKQAEVALVKEKFSVVEVPTESPEQSFEKVLKYAGVSHRRDAVDERVIAEVKSGKAFSGKNKDGIIDTPADVGGWPVLSEGKHEVDSDSDGMPDAWEMNNKLNPNEGTDANGHQLHPEYDNVEVYLNSLVQQIAEAKR